MVTIVTNIVFNGITILLIAIAAISLLVGGVGIMNIMYVVVTERTSEIGLKNVIMFKIQNHMFKFQNHKQRVLLTQIIQQTTTPHLQRV